MDQWSSGAKYEPYVGRWSRLVARQFLDWLQPDGNLRWLDVGCGTGALTEAILRTASPLQILAVDRSQEYLEYARSGIDDLRVEFQVAEAESLPARDAEFDMAVSGLVLNFLSDPAVGAAEMRRAIRIGGRVAVYVWDYAGGMQFMRHFWEAAVALDPSAAALDQGRRFPVCAPDRLARLFESVGLRDVAVAAIDIETRFQDFEDFWNPFLGAQGSAPAYLAGLGEDRREALRERLRATLPYEPDRSILLAARAWAVRGVR